MVRMGGFDEGEARHKRPRWAVALGLLALGNHTRCRVRFRNDGAGKRFGVHVDNRAGAALERA